MSQFHSKLEESHSGPFVDVNFQAESFMIHQAIHDVYNVYKDTHGKESIVKTVSV